jgi:hypothetical protein
LHENSTKDESKLWNAANLFHLPSVYVACLLGFLATGIIIVIYPPAGEQATFSGVLVERFWLPEILTAIWLGWFFYRRIPSKLALLAWIRPAVLLAWNVVKWHSEYDSAWDTFFGRDCGDSECLYQLFLTMPFYTGISYSIGALLCKIVNRPPAEGR